MPPVIKKDFQKLVSELELGCSEAYALITPHEGVRPSSTSLGSDIEEPLAVTYAILSQSSHRSMPLRTKSLRLADPTKLPQ
ncbi:unnamed protein product, partial [Brenthis ino]